MYTLFYEYYVSAQEEKEGKDPWLFEEEKDEGRKEYGAKAQAEGSQAPNPLEYPGMLPQAARLRKAKDFKEVFGKGKGVRDGRLFLKVRITKNKEIRFGIVVSKQVAAKAVERNRAKRLLREAVQGLLQEVKPGHDIVLVTLPGLELAGLEDAKQKVLSIMKKTSLLSRYAGSREAGKP